MILKTGRLWRSWACEIVLEISAFICTLILVFRSRVTSCWGQDLNGGWGGGPLAGSGVTSTPHWPHPFLYSSSLFFLPLFSCFFIFPLLSPSSPSFFVCLTSFCPFPALHFVLLSSFPSFSISPVTSFLSHQISSPLWAPNTWIT